MNTSNPANNETIVVNGLEFTFKDINTVVDRFYNKVAKDELLKIPFSSVTNWSEHIDRLTHFWWIRFGGRPYSFASYNPVLKHFTAGFNAELLKRWLQLFHETMTENLQNEQSQKWIEIATHMGSHLLNRNNIFTQQIKDTYESNESF